MADRSAGDDSHVERDGDDVLECDKRVRKGHQPVDVRVVVGLRCEGHPVSAVLECTFLECGVDNGADDGHGSEDDQVDKPR